MPPVQRILILAANPLDSSRLRLEEELREIESVLQRAKKRDLFELKPQTATRPSDIQRALLDYNPQIVHFCGHGEGSQGLVFEDDSGKAKFVDSLALANLFKLFADQVKCVVLNACYSEVQAKAIVEHIDAVIGMNQPISDTAAIRFAEGFYQGLGAGKDVEFAYKLGRNLLELQGIPEEHIPVLKRKSATDEAITTSRIFISYKRDVAPDEPVAKQLYKALQANHEVFIDQQMPVGTPWADHIDAELKRSDVLIVLLSEHSVHSEMVEHEVELAHRFASTSGKPRILPVRLAHRKPFQYPLNQYLDPLNWAFWEDDGDTDSLIAELLRAIEGEPLSIADDAKEDLLDHQVEDEIPNPASSAQPVSLESPDQGTMALESKFYIERAEDRRGQTAIDAQEGTVIIKGARQMGKSSLLNRMIDSAVDQDRQVVFLDFQLFDQPALENRQRFFRQFCRFLADELDLPNRIDDYWDEDLPLPQICTSYMKQLLKAIDEPMMLAMDEVDRVLDTPFRSDFFGMLRSWHNKRAMSKVWRRFSQVLVISTEPYQLIADLNQSPFNVGQTLRLQDFTTAQVTELNERHGKPFSASELKELMRLLAGHPYLVRRALYLIATKECSSKNFFKTASAAQGPFGGHLRRHLFRLKGQTDLTRGLMEILRSQSCGDEKLVWRLEGAGLVRKTETGAVARCELYAEYFRKHL